MCDLFFNDCKLSKKKCEKHRKSCKVRLIKWLFGKTCEKVKMSEKIRESSVYVYVCGGLRLPRKKVQYCNCHKNTQVLHSAT